MTREECWAVRRDSSAYWLGEVMVSFGGGFWVGRETRRRYATRAEALKAASAVASENGKVWLVHVRKKPKAPPALQVGDEVVVRGRVTEVSQPARSSIDTKVMLFGEEIWLPSNGLERVKP